MSFFIESSAKFKNKSITGVRGNITVHILGPDGSNREERLFYIAECAVPSGATYVAYSKTGAFKADDGLRVEIKRGHTPDKADRHKEPYDLWQSVCGSDAQNLTYWDHNGSLVRLIADRQSRQFFYEKPKVKVAKEGVTQGTLLFEGEKIDKHYSGTAYSFSKRCGSFHYQVSGTISTNGRQLTMRGEAPVLNVNCKVVRYFEDVLNFTLTDR